MSDHVRPVRALSIHADYRCRDTGVCCGTGWRIPVEPERLERLTRAEADGLLPPHAARTEQRGGLVVLAIAEGGACAAYEPARGAMPGRCAIHRTLGHDVLPIACQQFPRIVRIDASVSVSLSHYCPTAASALFRTDVPLTIVTGPAAFPAGFPYEGLDAREALPPLLRPSLLMDVAAYHTWEAHAIATLAAGPDVDAALASIAAGVERLRRWSPSAGALGDAVQRAASAVEVEDRPHAPRGNREGCALGAVRSELYGDVLPTYDEVRQWVPEDLRPHTVPPGACALASDSHAWANVDAALRNYAAARLFGSWIAYQGRGLRTVVAGAALAVRVARLEAARVAVSRGMASVTPEIVRDGIRCADLILMHQADQGAMVGALDRVESL